MAGFSFAEANLDDLESMLKKEYITKKTTPDLDLDKFLSPDDSATPFISNKAEDSAPKTEGARGPSTEEQKGGAHRPTSNGVKPHEHVEESDASEPEDKAGGPDDGDNEDIIFLDG